VSGLNTQNTLPSAAPTCVAAGRGFSVLPESTARYYQRADVAWMPITDIAPNEVRLAWLSRRHDPLVFEFVELAQTDRGRS
jgi:DNA-binding transcriptional LysR family regulator